MKETLRSPSGTTKAKTMTRAWAYSRHDFCRANCKAFNRHANRCSDKVRRRPKITGRWFWSNYRRCKIYEFDCPCCNPGFLKDGDKIEDPLLSGKNLVEKLRDIDMRMDKLIREEE